MQEVSEININKAGNIQFFICIMYIDKISCIL
jgi:hypothetical protein